MTRRVAVGVMTRRSELSVLALLNIVRRIFGAGEGGLSKMRELLPLSSLLKLTLHYGNPQQDRRGAGDCAMGDGDVEGIVIVHTKT